MINERKNLPEEKWKNFVTSETFEAIKTFCDSVIAAKVDEYMTELPEGMTDAEARAEIRGMKSLRSRLIAKVLNSAKLGSPQLGKAGYAHRRMR